MARSVKKKELSPEEKLAAALVPENEQPYKVPENWCWVKWGKIGDFVAGNGFKNEYQGFSEYEIPFYKVSSLKYSDSSGYIYDYSNTINEEIRQKLKATLIPSKSILFAKIGEAIRLNRRSINLKECCIDNNMMAFIPKCLMRYAFFWSCGIELYDYANATTVPAIRKSDLEEIPFPLAPLPEQQRIVDLIESLFADLNEAKEKLTTIMEGFAQRKAAILHRAFTGELTEKWREENNISLDNWEEKILKDCCYIGSGGTPSRKNSSFYEGNIPWIKTGEINWNEIYDTEEHISNAAVENSSAKLYQEGAVLVAMYGMGVTRGRAAILKTTASTNQAVCVLQPSNYLLNRFLFYYFMSNYWSIRNMAVGGNQLNLSGKIIENLKIKLPSLEEQKEIVRILDEIFAKEQQAQSVVESVLADIELLKKSILARAFRGELGTGNPEDERAEELLKRVL